MAQQTELPPRVLVVDDDPASANLMATLLEDHGFRVGVAYGGADAVLAAEILRPSAILLDLGMPEVSGLEVCRRVRREPWGATMRIVALTGWAEQRWFNSAEDAGFDGYLLKPASVDEILRAVQHELPSVSGAVLAA